MSYRKERDRKVRQLERETAAAKSKELATAESQINSDLIVSIGKLKSQLEKADAIKKILTLKVKKLSAENKQLQQKQESGIYVRQAVYKCQHAQLAAVKKQKNAERVKQKNAEDMASPKIKRELDVIQRMLKLNVDTLMSMDGEAQAMEAQFDGAAGEAAPSADFLDELEDLSLEELATAEPLIEGLQELHSELKVKHKDKQFNIESTMINSSEPKERATAILVLRSFEQDALNCITYCKGFEIECGSTSSMAVAWSTQAAVKATPMTGTYTMTYTDCLEKIITELEVEATWTTAIDYATDATTAAGTYTDYIKRIITELEDEVDYQECNQEYTSSQICSFRYFS